MHRRARNRLPLNGYKNIHSVTLTEKLIM